MLCSKSFGCICRCPICPIQLGFFALIFDILQHTFYIHLQKVPLCNWTTLAGRFGYSQGSFLFAATSKRMITIMKFYDNDKGEVGGSHLALVFNAVAI